MKAIVLGASGATGRDMVEELLKANDVEKITVIARRKLSYSDPRVEVHAVDFDKPESWSSLVQGDVLFSMLGTTLKAAGSKEAQWKVDYTYQYDTIKAARENGVTTLVLMSSMGADTKSNFFYMKMKGRLEDDVIKLCFPKTVIVRPPSLIRKNTDRFSEKVSLKIIKFLNSIGLLKSMTPVPTEIVSKVMLEKARTSNKKVLYVNAKDLITSMK